VIRATASKAGLLEVCQFPFREGTLWEDSPGRAAIDGNTFHAAVAPIVDPDLPAYTGRLSKWVTRRLVAAREWLAEHPAQYEAEVAYALDVDTCKGRVLGKNIGRRYEEHGRTARDMVGAADFVLVEGKTAHVYDWKTGRAVDDRVWPQMRMLGVLVAQAYPLVVEHVVLRPLHVTEHIVEDGMVQEMTLADLALAEVAMRTAVASIPDAWPTYGPHCNDLYCPARKGCGVYQLRTKESA
jgi:hypothetical protein